MSSKDKEKDVIDSVMYSYSTDSNPYEDENRILRETIAKLKEEIERLKTPPLMVCEVREIIEDKAIIKIPNGNLFYVTISEDCEELKSGDSVLADQKNLTVISKVPVTQQYNVEKFVIVEKPTLAWKELGGLEEEINEVKEVVELPLKKPELFNKVGIHPPKGILFYGEPGTGKTMLAKAVAASTKSTFIEVVGSELVQKFIGEGAKLVKDIFDFARKNAPAVVFIDEIDSLAAKRVEIGTSGEREVNRTFMQLLAELDGFKPLDNVKVIGATNRKDVLDPAILRPGRLDRVLQIPKPDKDGRLAILKIHTRKMVLDKTVDLGRIADKMEEASGAEIKAVCTEAGYFAIRENRTKITNKDLEDAIIKVNKHKEEEGGEYLRMFG